MAVPLQIKGQRCGYIATGLAESDPTLALQGALKPARKVRHMAALEADDLTEFLKRLHNYDGDVQTRLAIQFVLHTVVRTNELRFATWKEFKDDLWLYATRGLLKDSRKIDKRGTLDFPKLEIYRAALFDALADFGIEAQMLSEVDKVAQGGMRMQAPSFQIEGGRYSRGALNDAIRGVAVGEPWSFVIAIFGPIPSVVREALVGSEPIRMRVEFQCDEHPLDLKRTIDGAMPRGALRIDLSVLFAPLIKRVGLPF